MANDFYTNVSRHKNNILVCGYRNGQRYKQKVRYQPYLFVPSPDKTGYRNLQGAPVAKIQFESIFEAGQFARNYKDVDGFEVYGLTRYEYTYIYDTWPNIKYDPTKILTCVLDIEVDTEGGNPDISIADKEITAATLMYRDITFVLGYGDFVSKNPTIKYIKCKDEAELLHKMIEIWSSDVYRPDVVTGWNIEQFDIPYIVMRIVQVLGESWAKKLSPFEQLEQREFETVYGVKTAYTPLGVAILDYLALYKKFTYSQQESYKLNHIAHVELGEKKLDYSRYKNLKTLYRENHQLFMEYNVQDCELIFKLDDKMKLLNLVYTFAYNSGTNYVDAMTAVRSWDVIIHNYLMRKHIVVPQRKSGLDARRVIGAHVKDPKVGMHQWVVSFDLTSLYPHLIISYNISPDTYKGKLPKPPSIDRLLEGVHPNLDEFLTKNNLTMAANGAFYTKEFQGFLPALMEQLFNDRKEYKNKMLDVKKQYEKSKDPELLNQISEYNNLQMAAKIKLNSAYGAMANAGYRYHSVENAEAVTLSGQLTIRWAEKHINSYMNLICGTLNVDYVIASDTDSVYINMEEVVKQKFAGKDRAEIVKALDQFCEEEIQPYLVKIYKQLCDQQHCYKAALHMKRESISDRGIFVAKKRYILQVYNNEGVAFDEPQLKMMGIEAVRSSTPESCRGAIKDGLKVLMNGSNDDMIEYIESFRKQFKKLPFEEVAFPRGLNDLTKYYDAANKYKKGTPIHVRGAIIYNLLLEKHGLTDAFERINDREKIKFCYLKVPNPCRENVIGAPDVLPKEFGLDAYIDYDEQFDKAFLEPIARLMNAIGWVTEYKPTLAQFFE